jgi:MFS family permease
MVLWSLPGRCVAGVLTVDGVMPVDRSPTSGPAVARRAGRQAAMWAAAGVVAVASGCVAGGVVAAVGALGWYGLDLFVAQLAFVAFLLVAGHAAVIVWAVRTRPARWASIATQAPFMATYGLAVAWYYSRQPITRPHGFPLLYLVWAAAALSAVAWLTVWYTRNTHHARRAVAYLAALAVLIAVNGAGVFAVAWRSTGGFGLVGEPTPWAALDGLAATSCLSTNSFHTSHGRTVDSKCPSGPNANAGKISVAAGEEMTPRTGWGW